MSTVITVENLGKKYILQHQQRESYTALRDVLANGVRSLGKKITSPFTSNSSPLIPSQEDFWALKDVSFEVKQGDRIGIIGRNGAGKSTLLKILSRITEPTTGSVRIKGRVASLLEVGTGFHPELTGRENIFLNGAILGMSRVDIKRKFDEIVAFAEVERFLDTPVKRYSSGMYVRLAFAVAAHLEPEILIVDEVLAVGDAQFQQKCLGKMKEVGKEGRTVLFVSHNMNVIGSLCKSGILLDNGQVVVFGDVETCIENYMTNSGHEKKIADKPLIGNKFVVIKNTYTVDSNLLKKNSLSLKDQLQICLEYEAVEAIENIDVHIGVYNSAGVGVFRFDTSISDTFSRKLPASGMITCRCVGALLSPGRYSVNVCLVRGQEVLDYAPEVYYFDVHVLDYFGDKKVPDLGLCQVLIPHEWKVVAK